MPYGPYQFRAFHINTLLFPLCERNNYLLTFFEKVSRFHHDDLQSWIIFAYQDENLLCQRANKKLLICCEEPAVLVSLIFLSHTATPTRPATNGERNHDNGFYGAHIRHTKSRYQRCCYLVKRVICGKPRAMRIGKGRRKNDALAC